MQVVDMNFPSTNSFWYFSQMEMNRLMVWMQTIIASSSMNLMLMALLKKSLKGRIPASDLMKQSKKPYEVTVLLNCDW